MNNIYNNELLRDWAFENFQVPKFSKLPLLTTLGSGPFAINEFKDFLKNLGFHFNKNPMKMKKLIIGHELKEFVLDMILDTRSGKHLKVYSQEMFISFLLTGKDPFESGEEVLELFGEGHRGLEYLSDVGFDWPSTFVDISKKSSDSKLDLIDLSDIGPLRLMRYKTGKKGLSETKRREVLQMAYLNDWPDVVYENYSAIDDWGNPGSSTRLRKIAFSLATFCKNFKRHQSASYEKAIADYEEDLDWLKKNYYKGSHRFKWPDTEVY